MKRRDVLKVGGAAGAAGLLGLGAYTYTQRRGDDEETPIPSDTPTPPDETDPPEGVPPGDPPHERIEDDLLTHYSGQFSTIVDAIEVGADPDGEEVINGLLNEYATDDALLSFPSGTYTFDPVQLLDIDHVGLIGPGEEPTRFVPTSGNCRGGHPYVHFDGVSDLVIDNIEFDFRDSEAGGPVHMFLEGHSAIRNLTYRGTCGNQLGMFRVEVSDPDGAAEFENLVAENDGNQTLTGLYVSDGHAGELTFRNCELSEFSDNGIYASAPGGPDGRDGSVHVIGGEYRNNNISNVRLGSSDATAQGVTVVVDDETPGWGERNARGIRLRNREGQVIENCEITFGEDAADSFGAIVFHSQNGGATVQSTDITIHRGGIPAIKAFPVDIDASLAPEFRDVQIDGDATDGLTADIRGRDGTVFEDCHIEQNGTNRGGLQFLNCSECQIVDSHIETGELPVVLENSTVELVNTTIATPDAEQHVEQYAGENETITPENI